MLHKVKIMLDTTADVKDFVGICEGIDEDVSIIDGTNKNYKVNAKSFIGVLCAQCDFTSLYAISEADIYTKLSRFAVEEA